MNTNQTPTTPKRRTRRGGRRHVTVRIPKPRPFTTVKLDPVADRLPVDTELYCQSLEQKAAFWTNKLAQRRELTETDLLLSEACKPRPYATTPEDAKEELVMDLAAMCINKRSVQKDASKAWYQLDSIWSCA